MKVSKETRECLLCEMGAKTLYEDVCECIARIGSLPKGELKDKLFVTLLQCADLIDECIEDGE